MGLGVKGRAGDACFRCVLGGDVQTGPWFLPCSAKDTPKISRGQMLFLRFSSPAGKESACNAGAPGLIPGLGRSTGERIGYPLQCSWASLVAQLVKNPPAVWETSVQSLGWEDPLEKGKATHSSILAWRIPLDTGAWRATVHRGCRVGHD